MNKTTYTFYDIFYSVNIRRLFNEMFKCLVIKYFISETCFSYSICNESTYEQEKWTELDNCK